MNSHELIEHYDVTIPINSYIDSIAIKDVKIEGNLTTFELDTTSTSSAQSMTGLMLVENILFDIEKFVDANYIKTAIYNF
jgi:hypothetical protein